ncbi:MAG: ABC transporter ATP-binding protein, partial [Pseudolysinimonas sp.]
MSTETAPKVTPRTASEELVLTATDLVAGYLPGVNILNGCNVYVAKGELVGIIG